MSNAGRKIIDGLKDAVAGNFSRVTIEGQTWVRQQWLPIETAPTDREILGFQQTSGDHENRMSVCWPVVTLSGVYWLGPSGLMPTHWMPLPNPPIAEGR